MTRWTKKEHEYVMKNYEYGDLEKMSAHLHRSTRAITLHANRYGLARKCKRCTFWTPKNDEIMRKLYHNTRSADIAKMIGTTRKAVMGRAHVLGLLKDEGFCWECCKDTAFKKGMVPFNKGKKMKDIVAPEVYEKMRKNMFHKGHVPHNHKEVGSERISQDGYVEIKVAEPNVYMLKNRWIWEQAHGPIPPKHLIEFKDGNKMNLSLDNLKLVSMKDHAIHSMINRYPKELRDAFQLQGVLTRMIHKQERKGNDNSR